MVNDLFFKVNGPSFQRKFRVNGNNFDSSLTYRICFLSFSFSIPPTLYSTSLYFLFSRMSGHREAAQRIDTSDLGIRGDSSSGKETTNEQGEDGLSIHGRREEPRHRRTNAQPKRMWRRESKSIESDCESMKGRVKVFAEVEKVKVVGESESRKKAAVKWYC